MNQSVIIHRNTDPGDIQKQVQLRTKLQCKSFKWFVVYCRHLCQYYFPRYMENVAFDLLEHYPAIPPLPFAEGEVNDRLIDRWMFIRNSSDSKYGCTVVY